jgi:hypothetical protein
MATVKYSYVCKFVLGLAELLNQMTGNNFYYNKSAFWVRKKHRLL